jgi:trehalose 6-phosphate phosphatase
MMHVRKILEPAHRAVLREFVRRDTLLAFDYDGTLAPIVVDPAVARMRPETREALRRLSLRHPVAVISGRGRQDVKRFLHGVPLVEVAGNHGMETVASVPLNAMPRVAAWRRQLEQSLRGIEGLSIEDKRDSLTVHFRRCTDWESARAEAVYAATSLRGARLVGGDAVLNILPRDAPDKGTALAHMCERIGSPRAVFVGDDDTDEDVFALGERGHILGIRVGTEGPSAADYAIGAQEEIDALLQALLECA